MRFTIRLREESIQEMLNVIHVRFEVFMALEIEVMVFWVVTPHYYVVLQPDKP
jgi:hypothetical protein